MTRSNFWPGVPFLRILFPLITGIITGSYLIPGLRGLLFVSVFLLITWITIDYILPAKYFSLKIFVRFIPFLLIVFLSAAHTLNNDIRKNDKWFGSLYRYDDKLLVRIVEDPVPGNKTDKCEVSVTGILRDSNTINAAGNMLLYFPKASGLRTGDNVIVTKRPDSLVHSNNPGEFNYAAFLALKQVYHAAFVRDGEYIKVYNDAGWLENFISYSRNSVLLTIKKYIKGDQENTGLAQALLIGYRGELDKSLLQLYSITGVVHIIAVSGLHLGLIYAVINYLLAFIFRNRYASVRAISIILFLWFFSLLTGCSASVLRAAVMFSLLIIGKTWFRQTSVYNTLAASAVVLLLYDPNLFMDAGFQLSYLAVTGIVWLQPVIYRSYFPPTKIARKIWEMCSVTIAAQVMTLPVCIYYFHQFPILFLFANLLVVPLSTVILFEGIILICLSWWNEAATVTGWLTGISISAMNRIVKWFSSVPYSILEDLYIDVCGMIALFLIISGLALIFVYRKKAGTWITISALILLSVSISNRKIKIATRKELVVYKMPGGVTEIINGRNALSLGRTFHDDDKLKIAKSHLGVQSTLLIEGDIYSTGSLSIMIMDGRLAKSVQPRKGICILIITGNPFPDEAFLKELKPSIVVMDGSNKLWKIAKWKTLCDQLLLRFHSVPDQGAFIYSL